MAGWHHRLDGHEFGWTPGVGDGQGGLACCNSWGRKELDTTGQLNWTELDCSLPGSSVRGIFQARILEWVAISFSRGPSGPSDRTQVSCIADGFFTFWATREAPGFGEEVWHWVKKLLNVLNSFIPLQFSLLLPSTCFIVVILCLFHPLWFTKFLQFHVFT